MLLCVTGRYVYVRVSNYHNGKATISFWGHRVKVSGSYFQALLTCRLEKIPKSTAELSSSLNKNSTAQEQLPAHKVSKVP